MKGHNLNTAVIFYAYLLQFSKENPPQCSGVTVPPIAAMLKNFVGSLWLATTQTNKRETKLRGVCRSRLGTILRVGKTRKPRKTKGDG